MISGISTVTVSRTTVISASVSRSERTIADLVKSANDEAESVAVIDELYRLAGIYNTCILCVLHFVPNGLKLRGHLGSELQRKAATILSIEKDDEPAQSVVKALKVRDGSPLDVPLMLFAWDKEAYWVSIRKYRACEFFQHHYNGHYKPATGICYIREHRNDEKTN